MATATRPNQGPTPAAHGSRTLTVTDTPTPSDGPPSSNPATGGGAEAGPSSAGEVGVLRLRGRGPLGQRVQWTDETVDNEGLGRKKSKSAFLGLSCTGPGMKLTRLRGARSLLHLPQAETV